MVGGALCGAAHSVSAGIRQRNCARSAQLFHVRLIHQEESWGLFRPVAAVQPAYFSPTAANAFCASGLLMNVFQTKLLRWFSAINMVIPASIPMTSGSYHPLSGLKASTNP